MSDEITNRTGEYLKMHADIEHEAGAHKPDENSPSQGFENLRFGPYSVAQQIAEICRDYSTAEYEVVAEISWVSGKPVVALRKRLSLGGLDALLRHGSNSPLLRRQAG